MLFEPFTMVVFRDAGGMFYSSYFNNLKVSFSFSTTGKVCFYEEKKIVPHLTVGLMLILTFLCTVKPVYSGHPWDPKKAAVVYR
jgi:hypothetical protein